MRDGYSPQAGESGMTPRICAGLLMALASIAFAIPEEAVAANQPPTISGSPATTVRAGVAYNFQPAAADPERRQLRFSIANKPSWAQFNSWTGRLSGTPSSRHVGTTSGIVIRVSDGWLSAALPRFSITVTGSSNRAPTISGTPAPAVTAGSAYLFQPSASDPDGQAITYSIRNKPSWAGFSTATGRLSGTPTSAHAGTTSGIVITASDGSLSASLPAFSITVNAAGNRAPTVSGVPSPAATVGTAYRFAPVASDPDGDGISWSIVAKPAGASFSTSTGLLSWTPTATGSWRDIVITATDAKGAAASLPAFSITVSAPQPAGSATLSWQAPVQYTDGSPLPASDLAAFRIYRGSSAATLSRVAEVDGRATSFVVPNLGAGTHYFAVTAVTPGGAESARSAVGSKSIP
jgi:hypothetical protein